MNNLQCRLIIISIVCSVQQKLAGVINTDVINTKHSGLHIILKKF